MANDIDSTMNQGLNSETDSEWHQRNIISILEKKRKEQESFGITLNFVRYAGDKGNRQAIQEALRAAEEHDITTFESWKDSDGNYHANHPIADVKEAYRQIELRRMALITKESEYAAAIKAGSKIDVGGLQWLD